jgi:PAS domain S-box-containing protein
MILALIQNISLIISLSLIYQYILRQLHGKVLAINIVSGALFGIVAILAMLTPFMFAPGIFYDGRSIILTVGGLFGGPITAALAAAIASAFRIWIGGHGTLAGVLTIVESMAFGILGYQLRKKGKIRLSTPTILVLGLCVHATMLLAQLTIPGGQWRSAVPGIALPVLAFYPLGFLLICGIFLDSEERIHSTHELEDSEARYRLLFEESLSVNLIIDPETGSIVDANKTATLFYGWTKDELLSMKISDINTLPPDIVTKKMANAKEQKINTFHFQHRIKSGESRDVEVYSSPIEYYGKQRLYSIIHDISDRVRAENLVIELNRTLEQRVKLRTSALEDANKELESFAYSVSHDLRAPVRAIDSFTTLLSEELPEERKIDVTHYLDRIHFNARKISSIIEDLLKLSRINMQELDLMPFDLSALAKEVCDELMGMNPDRNISLRIESGLTLKADRGLIRILLENLFGNAWKYTSSRPLAHISFDSEGISEGKVFRVQDDGVGFDMAYVDKLFVPFQRLHPDQQFAGEGIGLSIARRIVVRHGGHIWALGEPGKGATFLFTIGA